MHRPEPMDYMAMAESLASGKGAARRPKQFDLRRAIGATYYALFHSLCLNNADLLVGKAVAGRSSSAWRQAYRAVNHGAARTACENLGVMEKFPREIQDFGNEFVDAQHRRHSADYDPKPVYDRYSVLENIVNATTVIQDFMKAPIKDRRAFAVWVTMPNRK